MDGYFSSYLNEIKSIGDLKNLFIERWNWNNPQIKEVSLELSEDIQNKIDNYQLIAQRLGYRIILFVLKNLLKPEQELKIIERKIITSSPFRKEVDDFIFAFACENFDYIDFIRADKVGPKVRSRRFSISPENCHQLRTPSQQLENLKLDSQKISSSYIKNRIDEAFSVEAVTERFYKEYIEIFEKIKKSLIKQKIEIGSKVKNKKLRDYIHQVFNRIMFLYFVQKRGCFNEDKNFLATFWDTYKNKSKGENKFHKDWLNVLFFESLSRPSWLYTEKSYLEQFNEVLKNAPYLNGGLFENNELDKIGWQIPDKLFDNIFEFFESYNFTIQESTPFEIEIAIDPEMLGNIYEHLVSVEEIEQEQAKAGIFYTPKVEIDLMIRRSLVEFLYNKTKIDKQKLYQYIFPEEEIEIEYPFTKEEAERTLKELNGILILDPACGSGHYLLVAEQTLYELKEILWKQLNKEHQDKYNEKKTIIEQNIYGNDIKEWAANIAKLRLWLDLFIDARDEILRDQREPLLPNLNFKIRCGDSLIQEIGHEIIPLRRISAFIKEVGRGVDLKILIQKKESVYKQGNPKEGKLTLNLEKKLLQNVLTAYYIEKQQELQNVSNQFKKSQSNLFNKLSKEQLLLQENHLRIEKADLDNQLNQIQRFEEELSKLKEPPMIWDLAFAEVFQMKKGFDVVIANPPYVRQELIEDLTGFYSKKEYKEKLIEQTKKDWEIGKFGSKNPIPQKFDRQCDLYVYFYLKGLKLLNEDGVLCYISSNSWLDVGYGTVLQAILLKRVPIIAIYDNLVKRSFKHADINTIIDLMKASKEMDKDPEVLNNEVRFVMFKKPFEEIMYSETFIELEKEKGFKKYQEGDRKETDIYRFHKVNQKDLYEFGKDKNSGQYAGNKWGGKYLRAPEIYWKILEKGKDKLVRLGDIAEVRRGFTTGVNEFFYVEDITDKIEFSEVKSRIKNFGEYKSLEKIKKTGLRIVRNTKTGDYWLMEEEFLKPVIKSPRECKSILINPGDLKYKVLMVHKSKEELKGKKVLDYIEWGEKMKFNKRPTCKSRKWWWDLEEQTLPMIMLFMFEDERKFSCLNNFAFVDATIYSVYPTNVKLLLCLNCIIFGLFKELLARAPEGLGALQMKVIDYENILIPKPDLLKDNNFDLKNFNPKPIFLELDFDTNKSIREQEPNPLPDRKALDDIAFDTLGLTEEERKEVYWAVAELVQNRLNKAKSM